MKYCTRCGLLLDEDMNFCPRCGLAQQKPIQPQPSPETRQATFFPPDGEGHKPTSDPAEAASFRGPEPDARTSGGGRNVIPFFIWSIVLIFICHPVGTPLGILGAVFASIARAGTSSPEKAAKSIRISRVLCIVATGIDILTLILLTIIIARYHWPFPRSWNLGRPGWG